MGKGVFSCFVREEKAISLGERRQMGYGKKIVGCLKTITNTEIFFTFLQACIIDSIRIILLYEEGADICGFVGYWRLF